MDSPIQSAIALLRGNLVIAVALLSVAYFTGLVLYRLFLSPLARFPGPKIAAATGYYEFYHDFFRHGQYVFEIAKMHDVYGPIVRINPHELSIRDPDYYNELYVAGSVRRTENYDSFARGIEFDGSHFLSTDHDLHRQRRKPLEPFFSRLGVSRLEPMVADLAVKLIRRLESYKGTGEIVRLDHAFVAFSGDVVGRVSTDSQTDLIEDEKFGVDWFDLLHSIIHSIPLVMAFPQLVALSKIIPESLLMWLNPAMKTFQTFQNMAKQHIIDSKREYAEKSDEGKKNFDTRISIIRSILTSKLPESDLSVERLSREAQVLLGAGTVSTARTLDFISFYIMDNDHIMSRLQGELGPLMAGYPEKMPTWADLEKLEYLQAIIKEGLRLSYGVMHRLPRVSPDMPLKFREWVIPKGIPVSMSAYMMHTDSSVYDKPFEFIPERWLNNVTPQMNKCLVPFSKGSRNCLGMNLAYAELNLMLAALFRPNGIKLELYETTEADIVQAHDYVIPLPRLDSKGFRVTVH